jgi:chromosome segregation ATPase
MTTVGKILVVLHLVLSIMFMAFAGAVYSAQNNWRKSQIAATAALAKEKTNSNNMRAEFDKERADLAQSIATLTNNVQKLSGQNTAMTAQVATLDSDNKELRKEVDQLRDQSILTSTEAVERKNEADLQREKNQEIFQSREELVKNLNDTEDKRFALDLQLQQVSEKYDQLLNDLRIMKGFLASKDLTTDPKQMIVQTAPPPPVQGLVTEVRKAEKSSRELVEISIGADDGLVVGHRLTLFRGDKYVAEIRLTLVQADKAVGYVYTRAKNATVTVGDTATTKL